MEQNQKQPSSGNSSQTGSGEKNPTLNEKGTAVPDYGNVMGGSSYETADSGQNAGTDGKDSGGETLGNP